MDIHKQMGALEQSARSSGKAVLRHTHTHTLTHSLTHSLTLSHTHTHTHTHTQKQMGARVVQSAKIIRQSRPETARGGSVRSQRLASSTGERCVVLCVCVCVSVCVWCVSVRVCVLAANAFASSTGERGVCVSGCVVCVSVSVRLWQPTLRVFYWGAGYVCVVCVCV